MVASMAVALAGCGAASSDDPQAQGVLSNATYWKEFYGPGDTSKSELPDVPTLVPGVASVPATPTDNSALQQSVLEMRDLYNQSSNFIGSFPQVEQHYRDIVTHLNKAVADKHPGRDLSETDLRTINAAIKSSQNSLQSQFDRVRTARASFDQKSAAVLLKAGQFEKSCNSAAQNGQPALNGCPAFLNALSLFRVRIEVTSNGFAHSNEVYEESRRSVEILSKPFDTSAPNSTRFTR